MYFKNISITNADDYSVVQHFTKPQVNGKLLLIEVDGTNPIEFNSGEIYKTIKVTLSKDIADSSNIKMNTSKSWNYQIIEETNKKASVNLSSIAAEGSVYLAGTKDFSLGSKITLAFTENSDFQFVKWEYDPAIIHIEDPKSINTVAIVLKATEAAATQIKAVCQPRLRVTNFAPVNTVKPSVSKNSSIVITFNQDLPNDEAGYSQLENITIAVGGSPVKSCFKTPSINANTITFVADSLNMLDVPTNQTKTVSVSIPADFYYLLDDGTKITYGGNGKTFDYKINDTTLEQTEITFAASTGSGTLSPESGTYNYSIGQEVPLIFNLDEDWKFNGWTITCEGQAVDDSKIKIEKKDKLSTILTVYKELHGVTVTANASKKLKVIARTPSETQNPKDSDITITFSKPLAAECSALLDLIKVSMDGISVDSSFIRTLNANTITLSNVKHLPVNDGTKTVSVKIPESLYYMDDNIKVNLEEEYAFDYIVSSASIAQTSVTYSATANSGTITPAAGTVSYSLDKEITLSFIPANGYKFESWTVTDLATGEPVSDTKIKIAAPDQSMTSMKILAAAGSVEVRANAFLITTFTTSPENAVEGVDCDTPIAIEFSKAITTQMSLYKSALDTGNIQIVNALNNTQHYEKYYEEPEWQGNVLMIRPKLKDSTTPANAHDAIRNIFSNETELKDISVKIDYPNIKDSDQHALQSDPSFSYRIKYDMEDVPPTVTMMLYKREFEIKKQNNQFYAEETSDYSDLSPSSLTVFNNSLYNKNHVGTKIYFDATIIDEGSGYKQLTIQETLIRKIDGSTVSIKSKNTILTSSSFEKKAYTLISSEDGVVQLDFIFEDYAGNPTTKTWYIIKDTTVNENEVTKLNKYPYTGFGNETVYHANEKILVGENSNGSIYQSPLYYLPAQNSVEKRITNSDGTITETFDFSSVYETFYSDKKALSKYRIQWGYSENNYSNVVNSTNNDDETFSFTRNPDENCFVKITVFDTVGNSKEYETVIPARPSIITYETGTGSVSTSSGTYLSKFITFRNVVNAEQSILNKNLKSYAIYTYQPNLQTEPTEFRSWAGTAYISYPFFKDQTFRPTGIYRFFIMNYWNENSVSYYSALSDSYDILIWYDEQGKQQLTKIVVGEDSQGNLVITNAEITTNESGTITGVQPDSADSPTFPDSSYFTVGSDNNYTVKLTSLGKSSGKHLIQINDGFQKDSKYTYGICYPDSNNTTIYTGFDFTLDSGKTYQVKLFAKNNNTLEVFNTTYAIDIPVLYDNIAPSLRPNYSDTQTQISSPNIIHLYDYPDSNNYDVYPIDTGSSGIKKNNNGLYEIKYCLIRKKSQTKGLYDLSQVNNFTFQTIAYEEGAVQIDLPYDDNNLEEGIFDLLLYLQDTNGNDSINVLTVTNVVKSVIPQIIHNIYDEEDIELFVRQVTLDDFYQNCLCNYIDGNSWKFVFRNLSTRKSDAFLSIGWAEDLLNYPFIQTRLSYSNLSSNYQVYYNTLYAFFCPAYEIKTQEEKNQVCRRKSVIRRNNITFTVYNDAPCFAHTMAYPTSMLDRLAAKTEEAFSEELTLNRAQDYDRIYTAVWESKGREYNLQLLNSDWTVNNSDYTVPVSQIPSGYSYVTIFHFADGTTAMSEVKQK